jgi:sterol desaturase/sphingolipid hydroxylase (fatty acid hydroxylase superfamily)
VLAIFAGLAAFFFLAERISPLHREQRVLRRGFYVDVWYVGIHYFMRVFINGTLAVMVAGLGRQYLPEQLVGMLRSHPTWVQALVVLMVLDFIFYVTHRAKHRWEWWWRLHETHHSAPELDWFASVRFHPLEKVLDRTIYLLPLLVIGPSDAAVLIWSAVDVFFGMFGHANVSWRIGPLIYVFVGPEMHRWHHALDRERHHCNFGNNFSIFDWIFGTAYLSEERPASYGVDDPNYPTENLLKQWIYAFRPFPPPPLVTQPRERVGV